MVDNEISFATQAALNALDERITALEEYTGIKNAEPVAEETSPQTEVQ